MRLGFSRVNINPRSPISLVGYFPIRTSTGIHDALYVRTHVFTNALTKEMFIFSTFDLVAVDQKLHEHILKRLKKEYKDYVIHVFVTATHTHSAPAGILDTRNGLKHSFIDVFGEYNEDYFNFCVKQCLDSIFQAITTMQSFEYRTRIEQIETVGGDRQDKKNPGDPSLLVLEFKTENEQKSLLYFYSCHPTVLNIENTQLSADLPYGVSRLLEGKTHQMVQFINGNSGNISTRFTRDSSDFHQIEHFGEQLVSKIKEIEKEPYQKLSSIDVTTDKLYLNVKNEKNKMLEVLRKEPLQNIETIPFIYHVIRLDHFTFLTIPGEITSDLVEPLKRTVENLFIMGYANDYLFYFASEPFYKADTYEAQASFIKVGEMDKAMEKISKRLKD